MKLSHDHVFIRALAHEDAEDLLSYRIRNQEFLQPFEPIRPQSEISLASQIEVIETAIRDFDEGTAYSFGIFLRETEKLIGRVNLSNVVHRAWQNCTIGYSMDQLHNGKGYMTQAVALAISFAFEHAGLHRVQAAVMPWNIGSNRVVQKVGFRLEGLSLRYLQINGKWEDHNIYAITAEEWTGKSQL